jgi:hypothetical protein
MRISISRSILPFALVLACTSRPFAQDDEAAGSSGTAASESTAESTSTSESSSEPSTTEADTGPLFVPLRDDYPVSECDPFAQDCPVGEKCVPASSDVDPDFDVDKCVPVLGDQPAGEPCTYGGYVESTDDCDESSFCYEVVEVAGELLGTCRSFCEGTSDTPVCPPGTHCPIMAEGSIILCIPTCDPLAQDCDEGLGCFWGPGSAFLCLVTTENIPTGEPCGAVNDCAPGNLCTDATALPSCAGAACCSQYCNLPDGDAGCVAQPGTVCTAFFEMGTAPAGYEHVGVCIIPGY